MKKLLLLNSIFIFILTITSYSQGDTLHRKQPLSAAERQARQQLFEQKADSAIANREVKRMKELFTLTPEQEQSLYQAGITINNNRRGIFKAYWKTEAFQTQMAKVDSSAAALYASIIGAGKYSMYKDALHSRLIQKQQVMQQRASADSLNRKTQQP
jgi:hypothetical protein